MSIIQEALKKVEPVSAGTVGSDIPHEEKILLNKRRIENSPAEQSAYKTSALRPFKKFRIKTVVLAILGIVLVLAFTALFFILHRSPAPAVVNTPRSEGPVETVRTPRQDAIYKTLSDGVTGNDVLPESPGSVVRSEPPDLVLNGIMYLETGPRAIINNNIVQEGDMIGGATIVLINKNSVILRYNNVEITLNLK